MERDLIEELDLLLELSLDENLEEKWIDGSSVVEVDDDLKNVDIVTDLVSYPNKKNHSVLRNILIT